MKSDTKAGKISAGTPPQSRQDLRVYIEEQLDRLARLASERGERRLAVALQLAALEAARADGPT